MRPCRSLLLLLVIFPAVCLAQKKIPIEVTHTGEDAAGRALVSALRETVRSGAGVLVPPESKQLTMENYGMRITSELARPRIRLHLMTAEVESANRTAISVNVIYDSPDMPVSGALIRGMVETCGRDDSAACAQRILTRATAAIDWLREKWPSLWRTL